MASVLRGCYFYLGNHMGIGWPQSFLSRSLFQRFSAGWDKKLKCKSLFTILSHTFVSSGLVGRHKESISQTFCWMIYKR